MRHVARFFTNQSYMIKKMRYLDIYLDLDLYMITGKYVPSKYAHNM